MEKTVEINIKQFFFFFKFFFNQNFNEKKNFMNQQNILRTSMEFSRRKSGYGLNSQSSDSFLGSASRQSSASLNSIGSGHPQQITMKQISYFVEKFTHPLPELIKFQNRIFKKTNELLIALISEKSEIKISIEREKSHIDAFIQDNEEREKGIRETLEVLKSTNSSKIINSKPPTIKQIRQISNMILQEGIKFKQLSENENTIKREVREKKDDSKTELRSKNPEFNMNSLSEIVFQLEDIQFQLNTTMTNRDMLKRLTFDHKTQLAALQLKKQNLIEEGQKLEQDFQHLLDSYSEVIGEISWKNAILKASNEISKLPKNSI